MPSDRTIIEAILLVAEEPVEARRIGEVLERPTADVEDALRALAEAYRTDERGFVLREVAGGWRLYTEPEAAPWLERFVIGGATARLSAASLEVLAVVAYKQPVARSEISEIRGVDSDRAVKSLSQRGLIEECGHDSGPGAPVLFKVSDAFLRRMGLRSVDELPPLVGFMPDTDAVEEMEAKLSPNV